MAKIYKIDNIGFPLFNAKVSKNYLLKSNDIRVSDVWSFLSYTIKVSKEKVGGSILKKSEQKFLLDLLEQSRYFYTTAEMAPIKSQPLLYYYSFMNLAKIAINLDSYLGNDKKYVHGISDEITTATKLSNASIKCWKSSSTDRYSVSEYLIKMLEDKDLPYVRDGKKGMSHSYTIEELLRNCVGIHKTFCEIYNKKGSFYKLSNIELYSMSKKIYFKAEIVDIDDNIMTSLNAKGYMVSKDNDKYHVTYHSSIKTTSNPTIVEKHTLAKKIRDLGIWSYCDGNNYKLYISDKACQSSTSSIIYHIMFFFGSITRYHPDLFDEIMSAKEYWLVSEFLKTQPVQFLYHIISKINGAEVLMNKVATAR